MKNFKYALLRFVLLANFTSLSLSATLQQSAGDAVISIPQFKTECDERVIQNKEFVKEISSECKCEKKFVITNKLINQCGGFVITCPGYYCAAEELVWKPKKDGAVAITVKSSDVVIDLKNLTLRQSSHSNTFNNIGIQVSPNLRNIIIKNGTVKNFSTLGLRIFEGVSDLVLQDLNVIKNGGRGTVNDYPYTANAGVVLLDVENITFDIAGGCEIRGLPDIPVKNVTVSNCNFNENSSSVICFGLFGGFLQDSFIYENNFSNNTGLLYTSGSSLSFPNNVDYYNNHGSHNRSTAPADFNLGLPRAFGISLWSPQGLRVDKCLFYGNNAAFEAGGLDSDPGSVTGKNGTFVPFQGFVCTNCVSDSNFVSNFGRETGFSHGFNFKQVEYLAHCVSSNQYNLGDVTGIVASSIGYIFRDPIGGVIEDCIAMNIGEPVIYGSQIISGTTSAGFLFFSIPGQISNNIVRKPSVVRNCTAQNCRTTSGEAAIGFGDHFPDFISFDFPGVIFENCVAEDIQAGNGQGLGFGITHMSQTIIKNSIARGNNVGFQFDNQFGAFTYNTPPSNLSVIVGNIASNNTDAGFVDDPTNINVYKNNEADNNGPDPANTNYIGMPTGTPIVTWDLAGGNPPPAALSAYDNLSVIQAP